MILYIIRHADPDYAHNTITPLGKEEALALGQRMSRVKLDRIYTSPLGRAIDTARPTMLALGMENTVLDWTAESMDYICSRALPERADILSPSETVLPMSRTAPSLSAMRRWHRL